MFDNFRNWLIHIKKQLPQNKAKADYSDMLKKLKKLEAQIQEKADQVEKAKASFLKNIYHEIRTPLNSIMGFTNLLSRGRALTDNNREEYLNLINESSNEFLRVMDDIIQAALLEAKMIRIIPEACRLDTFFEDLYVYFSGRKHVLAKNSIVLIKSVPIEYESLEIYCDQYRLNQVMNHLIDNALKFTERGVVEFGYKIKNKTIEFYVKDSNTSKTPLKEKYIFNRFTKADISDDGKRGLGLGLSICRELVGLMDGKIWYSKNNSGKGCCFHVSLPLKLKEGELLPVDRNTHKGKTLFNILAGVQKSSVG